MITRCFIGVDVFVAPAAVPARAIMYVKIPENRINGINSDDARDIYRIFFTEEMSR
jgi:phage-related protein